MHLDGCAYCMGIDFKNKKSLKKCNSLCLAIKNENLDNSPLEMIWMHPTTQGKAN